MIHASNFDEGPTIRREVAISFFRNCLLSPIARDNKRYTMIITELKMYLSDLILSAQFIYVNTKFFYVNAEPVT